MKSFQTKAPANLMLLGEHSVVYGQPALACAIDQWLTIEWHPRSDDQIHIHSTLAEHRTPLAEMQSHPKLTWVMAALQHYQSRLTHGWTLTLHSDFSATWGLGSSAAVLAAMLGGLEAIVYTRENKAPLSEFTPNRMALFENGLRLIHQLQGRGSGTDLAASLHGGISLFDPTTPSVTPLPIHLPMSLVYCGYKTPTADVLQTVADNWQSSPALLKQLYHTMGQTTQTAFEALQTEDLNRFYQMVNTYQGLMDALGVNDAVLSSLVYRLRQDPNVSASKISGSGLGDCVLGFGQADASKFDAQTPALNVNITPKGLQFLDSPFKDSPTS